MIKKEIEGKELKQVLHFRFSFEPRFSEVNKSLFLAPSLHTGTTSCNVHYCGPILYDNERETYNWSKSRVTRTQLNLLGRGRMCKLRPLHSLTWPRNFRFWWNVPTRITMKRGRFPVIFCYPHTRITRDMVRIRVAGDGIETRGIHITACDTSK
jgi:hypothetical protein